MSDKTGDLLKGPGLEGAVLIPNLLLLLVIVFYLLVTRVGPDRVQPLVAADQKTSQRIRDLERQLARNPNDHGAAIQLARLYQRAGQLPFSYDALRSAEQNGSRDARFRMKLGMAYVEIGKNADGQRVLRAALTACEVNRCPAHIRARLSIFLQVADKIAERKIDARTNPEGAAKVFDEVLKKVDGRRILRTGKKPGAKTSASKPSAAKPPASQPAPSR